MSEHDFGSDPWLDAKLRNVPIPVGLVAKLNQISSAKGAQLESGAQLEIADAQLDAVILDVPLPVGLLERLYAIPSDARRVSLHRAEQRRRLHLPELAVAASVLIAAGVFYLGWLWGEHNTLSNLAENHNSAVVAPDALVHDSGPVSPLESHDKALEPTTDELVQHDAVRPGVVQPTAELDADASMPIIPPGDLEPIYGAASGPVFGKDPVLDVLPELQAIGLTTTLGIAPPRVNGYDLLFQLKHGDHPFASPSTAKELASLSVPLETATQSFEAWKRAVRSRSLPASDSIRTEQFLAAMNYHFLPPSEGPVALRTSGGPVPADVAGLRLLQVGVQAASRPTTHAPMHLTVAIDASATMARSGGLEAAKDAVSAVCRGLGADDRISIIVFSERPQVLVSDVSADDVSQVDAALDSLQPGRVANLLAAVDQAAKVARRAAPTGARVLAILTDGRAELSEIAIQQVAKDLAETTAAGVKLDVIAVGSDADGHAQVAELAEAGKGRMVRTGGAADVRFALMESLTGQSQVVARKTSLKLVFNPLAVDRYRLVGHEAETLTAPAYAPLEVDLRSGEAATALVELWLKPSGGDDVAMAELTWQDAATGASGKIQQRISRLQFAKSFAETSASLQTAYLAAQAAESLRGSYYASSGRSLRQVLELAGSLSDAAQSEPTLRELLVLARRTLHIQGRSGASRPAAATPAESAAATAEPQP